MSRRLDDEIEEHLEATFGRAEGAHFAWQTRHAMVAREEAALVRAAFLPLGQRVLDVGCAEGATLFHLGSPPGAVGVDLFAEKIAFARSAVPSCTFVQGSAYELPFEDGRFDHVIVRDVIHHLRDPERVIDEIDRVLANGGRVDLLEPCRYNPLIFVHAATNRAERGELRSTATFLESIVAGRFRVERTQRMQALPIHRLVFHPKLGRPELARSSLVERWVQRFERAAARVIPRAAWAYVHVRGVK